jgi:hypothetical protein
MNGMPDVLVPGVLVRDVVRRDGFLATLDARTWRPRAHAAAALAQVDAAGSRGAYLRWLRRACAAWSRLPRPVAGTVTGYGTAGGTDGSTATGTVAWPLASVDAAALDLWPALQADLTDLAATSTAPVTPAVPSEVHARPVDGAFLVGAAHVAVVTAADAAVLTDAVLALAALEPGGLGTRFVLECRRLAAARWPLRRELAVWAAAHGPDAADRAVLTARALSLDVAQALTGTRPGW